MQEESFEISLQMLEKYIFCLIIVASHKLPD